MLLPNDPREFSERRLTAEEEQCLQAFEKERKQFVSSQIAGTIFINNLWIPTIPGVMSGFAYWENSYDKIYTVPLLISIASWCAIFFVMWLMFVRIYPFTVSKQNAVKYKNLWKQKKQEQLDDEKDRLNQRLTSLNKQRDKRQREQNVLSDWFGFQQFVKQTAVSIQLYTGCFFYYLTFNIYEPLHQKPLKHNRPS